MRVALGREACSVYAFADSVVKVLFVTNHPVEDASSRYRIYQYLPSLKALGFDTTVHPFTDSKLFHLIHSPGHWPEKAIRFAAATLGRRETLAAASHADVTVLHREAFPFGPPVLERELLHRARALVYSFDDALYAPFPHAGGLVERFLYRLKYSRDLSDVLRDCAAVIAGNEVLARYARQYNERVAVIPTAVDTEYYTANRRQKRSSEPLVVGWMGSPSTSAYLRLIEEALRRTQRRYGDGVRFVLIGDPDVRMGIERCEVRGWDIGTEIADLMDFDIGLMPLEASQWTEGKCAFKAILYMAAAIPVVASPVGAATEVIRHGETGLLATSVDAWVDALSALMDNSALRTALGRRGKERVDSCYSVKSTLPRLVDVLHEHGR